MPDIELTIGIPTFNGEKYIAEALDSVLSQLADVQGRRVEIIVSDNASTDHTGAIVKQYVTAFPGTVSYAVNPQNMGYDRNVDNLFKAARGEFVWLLGDDDMLVPGALRKFFAAVEQHKDLAVLVLSPSFLNINTGKKHWNRQFEEDVLCRDGDEFFQRSLWGTAAVSSLCVRKAYWNGENLDKYLGSQWIHIGALIEIMRHHHKGYIFADEMVVVRVANSRWAGHFGNQLVVGLQYLTLFEANTALGYDPRTFETFLESRYAGNLKDILFLKPAGMKGKLAVAKRMIHYFKTRPGFWLLHLPLLFTPNLISDAVINWARRAKRTAFRKALNGPGT